MTTTLLPTLHKQHTSSAAMAAARQVTATLEAPIAGSAPSRPPTNAECLACGCQLAALVAAARANALAKTA